MANTILNSDVITNEALRVLHQKCGFIGSINRQYDDSFAKSGAKIGDSLRIKYPASYTVRQTMTRSVQDHVETNTTLTVSNISGVDVDWTSQELTMKFDDFSANHIVPAMAVIAADIESRCLTLAKNAVAQQANNIGVAATYRKLLEGRKMLVDALAPQDSSYACQLNTTDNMELVDALKGQFNSQSTIGKQNNSGYLGNTAGMDFFENTLLPAHTSGTAASATGYLSNGVGLTGSTIAVDTGTTTFTAGDTITFAGVFDVHPETKQTRSNLKQFVVTANAGPSATSLSISPAIVATGGNKNVSNAIADNSAITKAAGASVTHGISLAYHKDAFTFATADLVMPSGVDMASRKVYDGISISFVRDFDVTSRDFKGRFDVLWGFKDLRPQHAVRLANS